MFSKKNHVLAAVLVVMVATAGYVNFHQAGGDLDTASVPVDYNGSNEYFYDSLFDSAEISTLADDEDFASVTVNNSDEITNTAENTDNDDTGAAVFVSNTNVEDVSTYFVEAKLEREQSRSKQQDILEGMINNKSLSDKDKSDCAKNMLMLQERMEKESAAEEMIKAKGFKEAYVRIDDKTVDVVVDCEALTEQQAAQIEDIVKRKTGFEASKIRITTLKK